MTTAREIMHAGASCVQESESLMDAARRVREPDVGALPVCGPDDRLHGIISDRDIVMKCLAKGKDPHRMTAGDLAQPGHRGCGGRQRRGAPHDAGPPRPPRARDRRPPHGRHDQRGGPGATPAGGTGGPCRRGDLPLSTSAMAPWAGRPPPGAARSALSFSPLGHCATRLHGWKSGLRSRTGLRNPIRRLSAPTRVHGDRPGPRT